MGYENGRRARREESEGKGERESSVGLSVSDPRQDWERMREMSCEGTCGLKVV